MNYLLSDTSATRMRRFLCSYGIYVVVLIAVLPVLFLRDFTPDNELRYVSIAAESLRSGTFFAFTNHGIPYADKPPLYLWICMAGYRLFGNHCLWFVTLFSLIPAFVITEVMHRRCRDEIPVQWHLAAKMLLLTSALFLGLALTMRMDMLMAMFIVLALDTFYRIYSGDRSAALKYLFPLYLFLALFTKGPYGILIPLVSIVAFLAMQKQLRTFPRYWGARCWGILLTLCALWFGAVYLEGGTEYLDNLLFRQTMGRAVKSFAHDAPFYFYFFSIWYSIAPWSPAIIGVIIASAISRRLRAEIPPKASFFLITSAATFIALSCFSAKLAVYMAPAFPFIVYGGAILLPPQGANRWIKASIALPAVIFLLIPGALIALPRIPKVAGMLPSLPVALIVGAILIAAAGIYALLLIYRNNATHRGIATLGFGLLAFIFCAGLCLDTLNPYIGYRDMAEKAQTALLTSGKKNIYTYRVRRPENLDVYLGKDIIIIHDNDDESVTLPPEGSGVIIMRAKDATGTEKILAASGKHIIVDR